MHRPDEGILQKAWKKIENLNWESNDVHTKLSFEMMPYCFLDSPQEYLRFLKTVGRKAAGVHLDICNTMNNPRRFYNNGEFIRESFELLKDHIVTLHLKDIRLKADETPAMLEHLDTEAEYDKATEFVTRIAGKVGMKKDGMKWCK